MTANGAGTYSWTGPNGFTSTDQTITIANATRTQHDGTYTVTISNGGAGCQASASIDVEINRPPAITVSSNSPICANGILELTTSGGVSYDWTGPNGFTSIDQNPTLPNALGLTPGTYEFTVTAVSVGGCTDIGVVQVVVQDGITLLSLIHI